MAFGVLPSGSLIQTSSRPDLSDTNAMYLPSGDHFGDWLRDAIGSGAIRVMSPRVVAIVSNCPRAEITARWPDGDRSNPSSSFCSVTTSNSFSLSSVVIVIGISVDLPDATSSFQMPKFSSYTITLPSLDIDGQNRLPLVCLVICVGWPEPFDAMR